MGYLYLFKLGINWIREYKIKYKLFPPVISRNMGYFFIPYFRCIVYVVFYYIFLREN